MNDLSLAQQYLLCVLKKNGKFPGIGIEKPLCFTASCVLELLMMCLHLAERSCACKAHCRKKKHICSPFMIWFIGSSRLNLKRWLKHFP